MLYLSDSRNIAVETSTWKRTIVNISLRDEWLDIYQYKGRRDGEQGRESDTQAETEIENVKMSSKKVLADAWFLDEIAAR